MQVYWLELRKYPWTLPVVNTKVLLTVTTILLKVIVGLVLVHSISYAQSNSGPSNETPPRLTIPEKVYSLINSPISNESFKQGLLIIADQQESDFSRRIVIEKLEREKGELNTSSTHDLLFTLTIVADNAHESPVVSAGAVRSISSLMLYMEENGQVNQSDIDRDAYFLKRLARDEGVNAEVRASAVRALGVLKLDGAPSVLRQILAEPIDDIHPAISRNLVISLGRLEHEKAIETIADVLQATNNNAVFGSAVFALGQIHSADSMARIAQYSGRFPDSGSPDAVIVDMEDIVLDVLKNPNHEELEYAIEATRFLWREGQRERYFPHLKSLLNTASFPMREKALQTLIGMTTVLNFEAEKAELRLLLPLVKNQKEFASYTEQINRRLSATLLIPSPNDQRSPFTPDNESPY